MTASPTRPMEIDDLFTLTLVSDPAVSPDGSRVAWVETRLDREQDTYLAAIWLAGIDGSDARRLTSGHYRDTAPVWSLDGRAIAFLSNRPARLAKTSGDKEADGKPNQVWTIDPDGGEALQVSGHPNGVTSPVWSPDGRRIAFVASDDVPEDASFDPPATVGVHADEVVVNDLRYRFDGRGFLRRFAHIWAVDLAAGDSVQLTTGDVQDASPAWSPDGRTIAFVGNRRDDRRSSRSAHTIQLVSANGGPVRTIAPDDASFDGPAWSPDGTRIAFTGHEDALAGSARNAGVWTVRADGSDFTNHTAAVDLHFSDSGMSDVSAGGGDGAQWLDAATLLVSASTRGATRLHRVPLNGKEPEPITGKRWRVSQAHVQPGGKVIAAIVGALDRPFALHTMTVKGKRERTIRDANASLHGEVHLASPLELDVVAPDGSAIQTWLLPPRGLDEGSDVRYPLILEIHGGPHSMYGYAMFHEMQVMASRGYGVVFCNPRGSAGYGEDFTTCTRGTWGESDMPDVIAALDAALELPWVDPERLGITGGSYGGYLTNWIIGHDDRFRAAVTQRCVSNFHSFVGTSDIGFDFGIHEFDGTPWADAEKLLKHSPISYVEAINTPLLILHSEQDLRCPIEQAEQMFVALRYLNREVAFVRIPSESHDLSRTGTPSRRVARLRHLIGWFDSHL